MENGGGEKPGMGTKKGHKKIADQEVTLRHGHILLLAPGGGNKIEHSGWTLHAEESAHQTGKGAETELYEERGAYLYPATETEEPYARHYEHHAKHPLEKGFGSESHRHYGKARDCKEGEEDG